MPSLSESIAVFFQMPSIRKVTVPDVVAGNTVAVKVTACPGVELGLDAASVTVVTIWLTEWAMPPVLDPLLISPE